MLPKSIGNLSSLQTFSAESCNLKGNLPNEIGNLRNLSTLRLGDNYLTGIVPVTSCLGDVTSLREVYLDSNNFTATIPSSLWNLKDILMLNLSSNFFNGSLPLEVGNLKAAILLDLSRNQISGTIPNTLGGLQKLIQLSLAHNRIKGSIPEAFGELINLEVLDLSYNNMSGLIPKSLEALKQLDYFNVSFNRVCFGNSFRVMRRQGKTVNVEDERSPEVAPQRISYYELQRATQGFDANNLLEYGLEGFISKRSDVYSFGIMLLETFIKKKPTDEMFAGDLTLRSWVHKSLPEELDQILDADLLTLDEQNLSQKLQCISSIMELAMKRTANIPVERMNMTCCSIVKKDQTEAFFLLLNGLMTRSGTFHIPFGKKAIKFSGI
ncbi:hypothetical protein BC332_04657 [Capsicum chinense]|nr:hypothetical protein BC332_04657 [Capsicum chinense]